jgi:hypothetical protein
MKTFKTISLNKSKFTYIAFCVSFFFFTATLQAQEIEVSGTVKGKTYDKTALLDGVNILLKGTRTGTTTNKKGEFTFPKKLKAGDILVFSYLGLATQNIKIKENSSVLNITLVEDDSQIFGALNSNKRYSSKKSKNK